MTAPKEKNDKNRCLLVNEGYVLEIYVEQVEPNISILHGNWYGIGLSITNDIDSDGALPRSSDYRKSQNGKLLQHMVLKHSSELEVDFSATLLTGSVIEENGTGIKLPCVIICGNNPSDAEYKAYILFVKNLAFVPHSTVDIAKYAMEESRKIHLLDGPNVVLSLKNGELLFTLNTRMNVELKLYSVSFNVNETDTVNTDIAYCVLVDSDSIVVISNSIPGQQNLEIQGESAMELDAVDPDVLEKTETGFCVMSLHVRDGAAYKQDLNIENFIHLSCGEKMMDDSLSIVTCNIDVIRDGCNDETCYNVDLYLLDELGILCHHRNGVIVQSSRMQLPGFQSSLHSCQIFESFNNEFYFCLSTTDDEVCIVRERDLVISRQFPVSKVFVGDFMDYGFPQLMVAGSEDFLSVTMVTDLGAFQSELSQTGPSHSVYHNQNSSLQLATRALEMRLQSVVSSLRDVEQLNITKKQVIKETSQAIHCMGLDDDLGEVPKQPNIVNLLCDDQNVHNTFTQPTQPTSDMLVVKSTWQHVIDDRWVIGMEVVNESKWSLYNIYISLSADGEFRSPSIESRSVVKYTEILLPTIAPGDEKRLKMTDTTQNSMLPTKCLLPGHKGMLGTSCPLPVFTTKPYSKVQVLLHWSKYVVNENAVTGSMDFVMNTDHVTLEVDDLFANKLEINVEEMQCSSMNAVKLERNVSSMKCACLCTCLRVEAVNRGGENTSLSVLSHVMKKRMGMSHHPVYQCYTSPSFKHLMVVLKRKHRCLYSMSVYHRNQCQFMTFLHVLLSHLPRNIVLNHVLAIEGSTNSAHLAMESLKQELHYSSITIRTLLQDAKQGSGDQEHDKVAKKRKKYFQESVKPEDYALCKFNIKKFLQATNIQILHSFGT